MFFFVIPLCHTIVAILLKGGANPNIFDKWGKTPLMYAVTMYGEYTNFPRRLKIIDLLLKYGADLNIQSKNGKTALDIATDESMSRFKMSGETSEFVNKLLNAGAEYKIDWSNVKYSKSK